MVSGPLCIVRNVRNNEQKGIILEIKQRIIMVIDSLNGGGAEAVVLRLLDAINHKIPTAQAHLVVLSQRGDYHIGDNPFIHILNFKSNKNMELFWTKTKVVSSLKSTVEHIEQQFGAVDGIFSHLDLTNVMVKALAIDVPKYYIVHNSITLELAADRQRGLFKYLKQKRRKALLNDEKLICVSKGVQSELPLPWLQPKDICTIYNPFDVEQITQLSHCQKTTVVKQPYILHIGRLSVQKRHDRLFEAFKALNTDHQLVLLTQPSKKLTRLIEKYQLSERVIVTGFQDNPFVWMRHADLLVLSSDYEGFGNVLVESLLCGTPVATTNCDHGPSEILADYHPEWIAKDFSAQALSQVMADILMQQPLVTLDQWPLYHQIEAQYAGQQYLDLLNR